MKVNSKLVNSFILFLISVSVISLGYIFLFQRNNFLLLALEAPEEVLSGEPFDLKVNFSNNSGAVLSDARLTLILPEGAAFLGADSAKNIDNKVLGNVGAGGLVQENYKIILFSKEPAVKQFKAVINYAPISLAARFEESETVEVAVSAPAVSVELALPEKITGGEEFSVDILYRNVSELDLSDLELKLEYPPSFFYGGASLRPDSANNVWLLGDLRKNSEGKFVVKGSLIGSENEEVEFKARLSTKVGRQSYPITEASAKTAIGSSPLSLSIHLNKEAEQAALLGETLNYTVSYLNNTDSSLGGIAVRVQLIGEMFDFGSLQSDGIFRSSDNTLVWKASNNANLTDLPPGSAGVVNFSIRVKENYPIKRFSDKNFVLKAVAQAENNSRVLSKAQLEKKVLGSIGIDAKAYFRDAESGFLNQGPLPPKVGQATNFTVHWLLKAAAADFSNVEARAVLGNNVKMVGIAKTAAGNFTYDENTREAVWLVEKLIANQGIVGSPVEAVFQIEAVPQEGSAGNYLAIIGPTAVRALDSFSGQEVLNNDVGITTALPDDPTVGQQGGVVQP